MKKVISILLLSLYLISTTEVYELLKIPTLIEHYWEHKKLNPEMTLTAFLKTHYENPVKDGDYGKDQKLPFVVHSAPLALIFTVHPNFYFETKSENYRPLQSHKIPSKDEDFCYKGFTGAVWEPPKSLCI